MIAYTVNSSPPISTESVSDFVARNNRLANFPKLADYNNNKKQIPFCPVTAYNSTEDWSAMLDEARNLRDMFVPHRSGEHHLGWESLTLHGLSSVHTGSSVGYGYENFGPHNRWTDVSDFTPTIRSFVKSLNFPTMGRVRIMKLRAHGYIAVHHDGHYGIGAINIALNNPINCNFYIDGCGILPFHNKDNENFPRIILPNIGYYHAVINNSDEDRYHIIIHAEKTRAWERIENESIT